jgi:hypothetical protein
MKRLISLMLLVAGAVVVAAPRWVPDKPGGARVRVTIYRVTPGRQLDFLKWMASQDDISREAGVATVQLYAHLDGDDWDFLGIGPATTQEQDKKRDEVAQRKGLKFGMPAWLEFRELTASHTDTFATGPLSAAELIAQATK